jgi:hypothetical protein
MGVITEKTPDVQHVTDAVARVMAGQGEHEGIRNLNEVREIFTRKLS